MQAFKHLLVIAGLVAFAFAAETDQETSNSTDNKITMRVYFTPETSGDLVGMIDKLISKRFQNYNSTVNPNTEHYPSVDISIDYDTQINKLAGKGRNFGVDPVTHVKKSVTKSFINLFDTKNEIVGFSTEGSVFARPQAPEDQKKTFLAAFPDLKVSEVSGGSK